MVNDIKELRYQVAEALSLNFVYQGFSRLVMRLRQSCLASFWKCEIIYRLIWREGYLQIYQRFFSYEITLRSFAVTKVSWKFSVLILFDFRLATGI